MLLRLLCFAAFIQLVFSACQQMEDGFAIPAGVCCNVVMEGQEISYTISCSGSTPTMNVHSGVDCSGNAAGEVAMDGVCTGSGQCDYMFLTMSMDNATSAGSCTYNNYMELPFVIGECVNNGTHSFKSGCTSGELSQELYDNADCSGIAVREEVAEDTEASLFGLCFKIRCGAAPLMVGPVFALLIAVFSFM
eukprot:UN13438